MAVPLTSSASGDPLAWPGAHGLRLALLAVLVVLVTVELGAGLLPLIVPETCAQIPRFDDCPHPLPLVVLGLPSVLAVVLVATTIYAVYPALIRRREGVAAKSDLLPSAFTAWVDEEIAAAGLAHKVRVNWQLADPRPRARIFGRAGTYHMLLAGGMLGLSLDGPARARAIVRHELAHVRHGDVDIVYAALSLWWAFLVVGLAPAAVAWVVGPVLGLVDGVIATGPVVLILLAARNLVLHDAEHRADLAGGAIHNAAPVSAASRFVPDWLRAHPTDEARRAIMQWPMLYLRVRRVDFVLFAGVAGLAGGISGGLLPLRTGLEADVLFGGGEVLSFDVLKRLPQIFLMLAASTALAYLLIRSRVSDRLVSATPMHSLSTAAWWALGLIVATPPRLVQSSLQEATSPASLQPPLDLLANPLLSGATAFLGATGTATLLLALWLAWLGRVADAWLPVLLCRQHLRPWLFAAILGVGGAIAPVLFAVTSGMQMLVLLPTVGALTAAHVGTAPALLPVWIQLGVIVGNPLNSLFVLLIGLLPLVAAWAMPRSVDQVLHARGPLLAQGQEVVISDPRCRLRGLVQALLLLTAGVAVMVLVGGRTALSAIDPTDHLALTAYLASWLGIWAVIAAVRAGARRQPWRWSTAAIPAALAGIVGALWVLPTSIAAGVTGLALLAANGITVGVLAIAAPVMALIGLLQRHKRLTLTIVGNPIGLRVRTEPGRRSEAEDGGPERRPASATTPARAAAHSSTYRGRVLSDGPTLP
jgi:hypothetical protein